MGVYHRLCKDFPVMMEVRRSLTVMGVAFLAAVFPGGTVQAVGRVKIRQLTFDSKNHDLDNNQNFSRDGKWIVYDTRNPGIGEGRTIEKVHVETGETVVLYEPEFVPGQGPGVGAAGFCPVEDRVVFIHGPWAFTGLPYDFTWRRGGMVDGTGQGILTFADARDITPPFTPGALRGGTHRHEWDGTGKWIGFTYNDVLMKERGTDLRTIGVTHLGIPVHVENAVPMKYEGDGSGFSVLVVRVVPHPRPGSDEIFRAAEDSWVGLNGYVDSAGKRRRARAFIGKGIGKQGQETSDVFIVDIPEDITIPGVHGPIEGTTESFPAPPHGTIQRRLTRTTDWEHPGVSGTCWSDPDGRWITFLAKDPQGRDQIFAVRPTGGEPVQVTCLDEGVACSPRWSPDGKRLVAVSRGGRLFIADAPGKETKTPLPVSSVLWLTEGDETNPPEKPVWSPSGNRIAFNRKVETRKGEFLQIFLAEFSPPR